MSHHLRTLAPALAATTLLLLTGCQTAGPPESSAPPATVTVVETVVATEPAPSITVPEEPPAPAESPAETAADQAAVMVVATEFFAAVDTSDWAALSDLVLDQGVVVRMQNNEDDIRAPLAEHPDASITCLHRADAATPANLARAMDSFGSPFACTRTTEETVYSGAWAAPTAFFAVDPAGEAWFVSATVTHWEG